MCLRVMIDVTVDIDLCCEIFLAILNIEASHQSFAGDVAVEILVLVWKNGLLSPPVDHMHRLSTINFCFDHSV